MTFNYIKYNRLYFIKLIKKLLIKTKFGNYINSNVYEGFFKDDQPSGGNVLYDSNGNMIVNNVVECNSIDECKAKLSKYLGKRRNSKRRNSKTK